MKKIKLNNSVDSIFVSDEDYERVSKFKWCIDKNSSGIMITQTVPPYQKIGRYVLCLEDPKLEPDHKNRNVYDNQRTNLRVATRSQNGANRGLFISNKSGVKGIYWHASRNKWRAQITVNSIGKYLGLFEHKIDAAKAYNKAAKAAFGEFAVLNDLEKDIF